MATAHHVAQRHHHHQPYSIPPPPPPAPTSTAQNNIGYSNNDDLRLPSIKDLAFKYESPREGRGGSSGPQAVTEFSVSSSQERFRGHPQSWGARPATTISTSTAPHPQQQHTPPLSANDNGGYLTPGLPLSAQTTPLPGSVSSISPAIRPDEIQNKRPRTSSSTSGRDSRPNNVVYPPQYTSYQTQAPMPPSSYQMSPVQPTPTSAAPPPPSAHPHIHQQQPTYSYHQPPPQQQQQQPYTIARSSPQHVAPPPAPHQTYIPNPSHPPSHAHAPQPQQIQAVHPPPPSHNVPYPSPSPSVVSQDHHWEQHAQPQPVHHPTMQHHPHPVPLQHVAPPPPPTVLTTGPPAPAPINVPVMHTSQYSHPPPPPPSLPPPATHSMTPVSHHPPQHQPQHPSYPPPTTINPHDSFVRPPPPAVTPTITNHTVVHPSAPPPAPSVDVVRTPTYAHTPNASTPPMSAQTKPAPSARESTMSEIVKLCSILYDFASRYSSLSSTLPHVQPSQVELNEMARKANEVVRLLEILRRMDYGHVTNEGGNRSSANSLGNALGPPKIESDPIPDTPEDHRPPKRPWEDMVREGDEQHPSHAAAASGPSVSGPTTAEQDMEIIRSKRATTTAGAAAAAGQPKSKYRKRSRATPPGKCHSCNIRETPEWRRGPDGARTLCNACGLHYAKLMRKQSKIHANSQNGEPPPKVDLETLKASTKAAEAERAAKAAADESMHIVSPNGTTSHHQGSFPVVPPELSPVEAQSPTTPVPPSDPSRLPAILPPPTTASGSSMPPPPPWAATGQFHSQQSQSFIRTVSHR